LRFLVAHAAGEIAVGRADATNRRFQPSKGIRRPAQTGGTRCVADLGAGDTVEGGTDFSEFGARFGLSLEWIVSAILWRALIPRPDVFDSSARRV